MGNRRMFRASLAAPVVALAILACATGADAMYHNGAFVGQVTNVSGAGSLTLPAGAVFPQVTGGDITLDADRIVGVLTGVTMDFHVSIGEFAEEIAPGTARYSFFQLADGGYFFVGTYTMTLNNDSGPYPVSGPVVGDKYGIYFPGKSDGNTPGDTSDDFTFLIRARALPVDATAEKPTLLGRAQLLVGTRLISATSDTTTSTNTSQGAWQYLSDPGLTGGSTFNQIVPADGSADLSLGGDTPALFISNLTRSGTTGAGVPVTSTANALRLVPGGPGTPGSIGIGFGRFKRTLPGGKTFEGFNVLDIGESSGGSSPSEGYVFAFVTPETTPALLYGTSSGTATTTGATLTTDVEMWAVDSAPADALPGDTMDSYYTDRYLVYDTATTDLNGWRDLRSVQLLINNSTATNRIVARYDVATNRLALFNKALGKWTAGCLPGSGTTLRTPWVSLSCKDTTVYRGGEVVSIGWSLKPTSRMLGSWNAYLKITDSSGQITGWRAVNDDKYRVQAHP